MNPYNYSAIRICASEDEFRDVSEINIRTEYQRMLDLNYRFIKACKLYIIDHYKEVESWKALSIIINGESYGKTITLGKHIFHAEAILYANFEIDWSDGDLTMEINNHGWVRLSDYELIQITFYIDEQLLKQKEDERSIQSQKD